MAMTMTGQVVLPAERTKVWEMLNDPEVLGRCLPGCEQIERTEDGGFRAVARIAVGPIKARFKGKVALTEIVAPTSYVIVGEGEGGIAGFAKGTARVVLKDVSEGTELTYDVEAVIGGKMAQLGGRMINTVAKRQADEFFGKFEALVSSGSPAEAANDQLS